MSNYLISGANGFIGKRLTERLKADRHVVVSIPRTMMFIPEGLVDIIESSQPDYIIHLSAYGNHYNQTDPDRIIHTNIKGTLNLLRAAQVWRYKKFYNVSSSSVLLPKQTVYSITKMCAEKLAATFPNTINVRPYSVYGPGEAGHRFIPTVIDALKTGKEIDLDPDAKHDWIFIDDFINGLLAGHSEIGTGLQYSNLDIVRILCQISGRELSYSEKRLRDYDTDNWVCPEGVPHISIEEGLLKTWLSYQ